ncbi:MAG TPA: DnaA/Hda family protein [Alphaproteobacteria bacterium]|nr:DnaA/Hda family protein [Alphaproteobacteria bacterium]
MHKPQQIALDLGGRSAHAREDFLIGRCNSDAVRWIDRWPEWPAPALIITGPAASGKTHLAAVWKDRSQSETIRPELLLSSSAEELAATGKNLVIDGIDLWLGERKAEETLFHLYNIFKEEGRSFLLTMRMTPTQADFVIPDLASRLRAAPLAAIHPPDDMLLASVLIKLFSDRQLPVGNEVISYILPRMERSFSAARDIARVADQTALAARQRISVPLMRKVLAGMQDD